MTAKEYFAQAYRLDQRINSDLEEIRKIREMAVSMSSPSLGDRVCHSRSTTAPFTRRIENIVDLEREVNDEIDRLVALKRQMRTVIESVANINERVVLDYRYVHCCSWQTIARKLFVDERTARRWHNKASDTQSYPMTRLSCKNCP